MQVLKFGGSSVADAQNIGKVVKIVEGSLARDKTIVVASAIGGATDLLIEAGHKAAQGHGGYTDNLRELQQRHEKIIKELEIEDNQNITEKCRFLFKELKEACDGVYLIKELSGRSLDKIMSFGELLSTTIISGAFYALNIGNAWCDARELIVTQKDGETNKIVQDKTLSAIKQYFEKSSVRLHIVPGFIARDIGGFTTTLGRGGSDYTASIIAVGVRARRLEIWTDVSGMMSADPRVVREAHTIRNISYKEALELSYFGAKVVYPPTIQPVVKQGIPIYVKNTFKPEEEGTLIEQNPPEGGDKIRGISSSSGIALLRMEGSGMVGVPGYSGRLFEALARSSVNIILITQASSVYTMCVAIGEHEAARAKKAADEAFAYEISLGKVDPVYVEGGYSIISLVGDDLKNQSGATARMFDALGREGLNIRAIAQGSSEKNISVVLSTKEEKEAIRAIHNEFFGNAQRRVNLFVAGCGTVGSALLEIIDKQKEELARRYGKRLCVCGISNSKHFVISHKELNANALCNAAAGGQEPQRAEGNAFIQEIIRLNLAGSIFVDCTANKYIAASYPQLLNHKIGVVTCNKIANSSSLSFYNELLNASKEAAYRYETTVGAALPILSTVRQMVDSGDKITSAEGILSGTLNWLLSNYDGMTPFAELVAKAKELGYTEPDPNTDLSGTDVQRKLLILAREAGYPLEEKQIEHSLFFTGEYESRLKKLYGQAKEKKGVLRFIARFNSSGEAKMGIEQISESHPFASVAGSDNALFIQSEFYPQGILIRGAGAGARQTAQGVLNDILRAGF